MPKTSTERSTEAVVPRRDGYRLDDQVGFLLRRAYQRASGNLIDRIGVHDLTAPQFATLARLHECGKLSQNRLGRLVAMEPANIRDVVQRLKRRRLVSTGHDPTDARLILVALTAAGRKLVEGLLPVETACTARTLAPLDPVEQRLLYALLRKVIDG